MTAPTVSVRRLSWRYIPRRDEWQAETPFGPELIHFVLPEHFPPNGCYEWNGSTDPDETFATLEAAKDAVQSGYEALILSALEPTPSGCDPIGETET